MYLTERTDVAFRPFGLDLFDKLVQACRAVRKKLESERDSLASSTLQTLQVQEGTAVARLLGSLSSLTRPDDVRALATLSDDENTRLTLLKSKLADLQASDPAKTARELSMRAGRFRALAKHLNDVSNALSSEAVRNVFDAQQDAQSKAEAVQKLRENTFSEGLLSGTGSASWGEMWEKAREFSQAEAYPEDSFPVTTEDAVCVLCQQGLSADAGARLQQFETFVTSTAEKEFREAKARYSKLYNDIDELNVFESDWQEAVKEVRIEQDSLADELEQGLVTAQERRDAAIDGLKRKQGLPDSLPEYSFPSQTLETLVQQLDERARTLTEQNAEDEKQKVTAELQELKDRQVLANNIDAVINEIERKKKIAAYELCLSDVRTNSITTKSTAVTRIAVTEKLKASFAEELGNLRFKHVEVELDEAGGDLGNLYHRLILKRAPGVELPKVVSEGEARCLSIAAFFAELSTADDPSAILFDDPVSSLDYKWRENVARRLVEEAKTRQVIVFTHDIVFLLHLHQFTEEQGVNRIDQHVRQLAIGAGVCAEELPWVAMSVKRRIGYLKNGWQAADKLFREGHQDAYEKEASRLYGLLREAWERGLEEVLLGSVVERYRPSVQTQHIGTIADISSQDCSALGACRT
ncbi:MAG: hypothetical protein MAG794_00157 [Gammaproteobacteria bacterium]|nr:hypothetical protein [Gammaproteobacteria bacterium]